MKKLASELYITDKDNFSSFNYRFSPNLSTDQEKCQLLVEIIIQWRDEKELFCKKESWYYDENCGALRFDTPSECPRCLRTQKILDLVFGDHRQFLRLPFVYRGRRNEYSFSFFSLKLFAEEGIDETEWIKQIGKRLEGVGKKMEGISKRLEEIDRLLEVLKI